MTLSLNILDLNVQRLLLPRFDFIAFYILVTCGHFFMNVFWLSRHVKLKYFDSTSEIYFNETKKEQERKIKS